MEREANPGRRVVLSSQVIAFDEALLPKNLEAHFDQVREEGRQQMTIKGWAPHDTEQRLDEYEHSQREAFDRDVAVGAQELRKSLATLVKQIDAQEARARTLPEPTYATVGERQLGKIATVLERQELRAQMQTRTVADLAVRYEAITDADDPALVRWIEEEARDGFPTLGMRSSDDPVVVMRDQKRLTQAIEARRAARTPPLVREVRARLVALGLMGEGRFKTPYLKVLAEKGGPAADRFRDARDRRRGPRPSDMALA